MVFHENRLPADDSHEISCLICYFEKSADAYREYLSDLVYLSLYLIGERVTHHKTKETMGTTKVD